MSGEVGGRLGLNSLTLAGSVSAAYPSSSMNPVGSISALYGRLLTEDSMIFELQAGPVFMDGLDSGTSEFGLVLGAHLAAPFGKVVGFGIRPTCTLTRSESYFALTLGLEFGKLK